MNKKKIAALALSGTLLAGAAGFGAYSWFTSSATVTPNLVIKTGTLEVTANPTENKETNGWVLQNTDKTGDEKTEAIQGSIDSNKNMNYSNVRPGDSFIKHVKIQNTGTLKERLVITPNTTLIDNYGKALEVTITKNGTDQNLEADQIVLNPTTSATTENPNEINATIKVTIKDLTPGHCKDGEQQGTKLKDNFQGEVLDLSKVLGAKDLITVDGHQVNEPLKAETLTQQ